MRLHPSSGPPLATTILIRGGHLPPSSPIQILWSPRGRKSAVSRTAYSDSEGRLVTEFGVPTSQQGQYVLSAQVAGVRYASASYRIRSPARLAVTVTSDGRGETLSIQGSRFIPHLRLVLIVYPMGQGTKPILLGSVRTGPEGSFRFSVSSRKLSPGQYALRAWSTDAFSAQMAESFFQVVI